MKKRFILILCLLLLLAPSADAALGSKRLIINHGVQEITIHKGEKKWLYVQDGWSKLPQLKGVSFFSDNTFVASVGLHSGILRGNSIGTAHLTIMSSKGHSAYIKIKVVPGKGTHLIGPLLFLAGVVFLLILIAIKKK
ncbi:MAG: hypothetical protein DBX52_04135 [Clostridiales bacterium]|nr:MAG: hypothetical protein DBX52_04135 [Clostridiales bacterium]